MERASMRNLTVPTWFQKALENPEITDLLLNGIHQAYIDQGKGLEPLAESTIDPFTETSLRDWVIASLSEAGKSWDAKYPFIDASLRSGHRLHVTFPPISRKGILISLRRLPQVSPTKRWEHSPLYPWLVQAVCRGDSIILSGATGSGKTTLASDLLSELPKEERIIALEDTSELNPHHPHFLSLVSRPANAEGYGEITLRTLLRQTLRMRPDRIVLGECRGNEVLELLQALNTGHQGALATLHANSPKDALRRIELLCILASQGALPIRAIRELLSVGIQWIAQVKKESQGRTITEVWKIEGREEDTILMRKML
jgi:pilus assembly protein CpaF